MNLEQRPIKIYNFPLTEDTQVLRVEQVIIRFSHGKTVDIGSLCYLVRQKTKYSGVRARNLNKGLLVQLDSFSEQRVKDVRNLLICISNLLNFSGQRLETIRDRVTRFIPFMYWADENGHHDVLNNIDSARESLYHYIYYLKERIQRNEITFGSAKRQQNTIIRLLSDVFEYEELRNNLPLMQGAKAWSRSTAPPDEDNQSSVLALCNSIFDGLTNLILDFKPYPFKLHLPDYLKFKDNALWVFPAEKWFIHPQKANQKRKVCLGFNYQSGSLNTIEEINMLRIREAKTEIANESVMLNARTNICNANQNYRDSQRMHIATIAFNVFIILLIAQTGMNWAQLLELGWDDDFLVSNDKQLFRTIKWRAHGKTCYFELPIAFMPKFKRFIALRKYLLNNRTCDYLLFTLGERGLGEPQRRKTDITSFYDTLKKIDPNVKVIGARTWRAAKSDWLIRNTDVSTTSLVLQNTEKTVLASYATGTRSQQLEEISLYLNSLSDVVINEKSDSKTSLQGAIGQCLSFQKPLPIVEKGLLEPNCIEVSGCLFCKQYRVHADAIDIRKLLSFKFYIEKTIYIFNENDNQSHIIDGIMQRIKNIINELSKGNEKLVANIHSEVEDGELDFYWSKKIEQLIELGWFI